MSRAIVLTCCAILPCAIGSSSAQSIQYAVSGTAQGGEFGWSVAGLGDLDGDGRDDFAVAAIDALVGGVRSEAISAHSGFDGAVLWTVPSPRPGNNFGRTMAAMSDVNGDGYRDLVVGASRDSTGTYFQNGAVFLLSGRDGAVLHFLAGSASRDMLGHCVAELGDLDRDGISDYVATAAVQHISPSSLDYALVVSGRTGTRLATWMPGGSASDDFGFSAVGLGDVDGDGAPDAAISARQYLNFTGLVLLFSGRTGAIVQVWTGRIAHHAFGYKLASIADQDGDGRRDLLAASAPSYTTGVNDYVELLSSGTGATLRTWIAPAEDDTFGRNGLAALPDIDGDGKEEVLIGATQDFASGPPGYVHVYGSRTGVLLLQVNGTQSYEGFGMSVCAAGDLNLDGRPDFLVGAIRTSGSASRAGSVFAYSSQTLPLTTDQPFIDVASGDVQALRADFGAAHARDPYLVLGTASDIQPGLPFFGNTLPLNPDAYFLYSLRNPGAPPLEGGAGLLDLAGRATCRFTPPPTLRVVPRGLRLHHAFVVLAPGAPIASNAAPLALR